MPSTETKPAAGVLTAGIALLVAGGLLAIIGITSWSADSGNGTSLMIFAALAAAAAGFVLALVGVFRITARGD